jgi:Mn-dependent DtxR family transcriptional regulator
MSVADTSIENYIEHRDSGKMGAQALSIFIFLKNNALHDWSRAEVSLRMGIPLSSVCGRVNQLIKDGYLETIDKRQCKITGKTVNSITVKSK